VGKDEHVAGTKGRLLVATPLLTDHNFERTVVLMLEDNEEGALGLVLNRPSPLEVGEPLPDWADLSASPPVVFVGGPVSRSSVIALARCSDDPDVSADTWTSVLGPIGVLDLTADAALLHTVVGDVRVFAGYAGWGAEQLVAEIGEGAWFVVDAQPSDAVTEEPEQLWRDVLRRQPDPVRQFANYPPDLSVN
jgi:putative transcriptional regulator